MVVGLAPAVVHTSMVHIAGVQDACCAELLWLQIFGAHATRFGLAAGVCHLLESASLIASVIGGLLRCCLRDAACRYR